MNTALTIVSLTCSLLLSSLAVLVGAPGVAGASDGLHACDYQQSYGDIPCTEVDRAITETAAEFGQDDARLRRIVRCESKFNPYANGGEYRGLFQQAESYWNQRVADFNANHDPDVGNNIHSPFDNSRVSGRMLASGLDEHWPNCA